MNGLPRLLRLPRLLNKDVRNPGDDKGKQRGEHDVQSLRHPAAHPLFDFSQEEHANDRGQNAAASAAQI